MMVRTEENLKRGKYYGTVSTLFLMKQWLRNVRPHSLFGMAIYALMILVIVLIIIPDVELPTNIFLTCACLLVIYFSYAYPLSLRSFERVDFYQEEIILYGKQFFLNKYGIIRMRRNNVSADLNNPAILKLKDSFDPLGRSKSFVLSHKCGWALETLSKINDLVKDKVPEINDPALERLRGAYVGTIESGACREKLLHFGFYFALLLCAIIIPSLILPIFIAVIILAFYHGYFMNIKRIDIYEGELVFLEKERFQGVISGCVVNPQKIKIQDTHDIFQCRMLKIKEDGSSLPISLARKHGWSDEALDEVKEVIAKAQGCICS